MRRFAPFFALALLALTPTAGAGAAPTCHGTEATIIGTGGDDTLRGTPADDVIVGLGGNDSIDARGGADVVCAGDGDDAIRGGGGGDWIDGGEGDDAVFGDRGRDSLLGSAGADDLYGGRGDDRIKGGAGEDIARGGRGGDTCWDSEEHHSCLRGITLTEVARLPGSHNAGIAISPPDDDRLFLVDQSGPIWEVGSGGIEPTPLLDLTGRVSTAGEEGVLGLAFHPDYASNGRLFVFFTRPDRDIVIQGFVDDGTRPIDPTSGAPVITIDHSAATNHNGGMLAFGPDGALYVSVGDGGTGGATGQDTGVLLGKILRLDVDSATPYATPIDNPFVGRPGADEIWAFGLRNPWRFSFDPITGLIYIADVGQAAYEEIDIAPDNAAGNNYGWNIFEGDHCYSGGCDATGKVFPVLEVAHGDAGTCSIIGGFVYRGRALPEVIGRYFYGDYCGGWIRSFRYAAGSAAERVQWLDTSHHLTSFGVDSAGELYVATDEGALYRIDPVR